MSSIVVIVGRPNVGKSTLFNRLSRSRDALVDDRPGITRDRLYTAVWYDGAAFTLVDTGGFDDTGEDPFLSKIKGQIQRAVEEADMVIFMVDGRVGVMPGDEDIARMLRRTQKKILVAANKIDGPEQGHLTSEFYGLGLGSVFPISAAHGYGLRTMMEELIRNLPGAKDEKERGDEIRVAVLGRPNVGKSSLINRMLDSERLLVSELPGTTRDSVDTPFRHGGRDYLLIDTAGIRRKARVKEKIEKFSVIKALRSLDRCHVAVILLDATEMPSEQDARICGYAFEKGKGLVLAANKWDLVKKDGRQKTMFNQEIDRHLKFISFAPRVNISALTGQGVMKLLEKIQLVYGQFSRRFTTSAVNKAIKMITDKYQAPRMGRGERVKVFYGTQVEVKPPTFVLFVNKPDLIHFSYERFWVNQLRESLGLEYTPIRLKFQKK